MQLGDGVFGKRESEEFPQWYSSERRFIESPQSLVLRMLTMQESTIMAKCPHPLIPHMSDETCKVKKESRCLKEQEQIPQVARSKVKIF